MCVVSATMVALAHNLVSLRERGILKRIRGTPLPPSAYLAAIAGNALTNTVVQIAIVLVAGRLVFGVQLAADWGALARVPRRSAWSASRRSASRSRT